jgi:hypothetical protein
MRCALKDSQKFCWPKSKISNPPTLAISPYTATSYAIGISPGQKTFSQGAPKHAPRASMYVYGGRTGNWQRATGNWRTANGNGERQMAMDHCWALAVRFSPLPVASCQLPIATPLEKINEIR